jgi:hypothetical protein
LSNIDSPTDGNRVRLKRQTQADSVSRIVQRLQTNKPFINLVVTGDFNAYQFTDGYVDVLGQIMGTPADASQALVPGTDQVNPDLINKVLALPAAEQYSFNFNGSAQVLDHALVSQTLNPAITGVAYARGNSDAAENLEFDGTTPLRASDHDGLVLYITPIPVNANAGDDREICFGQSTTIGGAPTGSGGTGALTFNWTPVDGLNDPGAANPIASPTVTTTYTVIVTDANNTSATDQVTITVNPQLIVAAGGDRNVFYGQTTTLGGSPTASGGTPPYNYSWTPVTGFLSPADAANPKTRPLATTTYEVTVTDAKGCVAKDQVTIAVLAYVFLSDNKVKINKNKQSYGNIHSNEKIEFGVGAPGTHTGNLSAVDDITIRDKNTIVGNAKAGDEIYLFGNAKITGSKAGHAAVAPMSCVPISFVAGGPNVTIPEKASKTLAPGSYGRILVDDKATLFLRSGEYYIDVLDAGSSAKLFIDVANGPVTINVVTDLQFDEKVQVLITGGGTQLVTFVTLQDPKVDIGIKAVIRGTIIAQEAEVHFSRNCKFKGAIYADGITLDPEVIFQFHTSTAPFPKEAELDEDEAVSSDESPVTSYELAQNYPNPFSQIPRFAGSPSTKIRFSVLEAGVVQLTVYNLQGQEVRTLVSGQMNPGRHAITWNGRDNAGKVVPSGVYLYKLRVNGFEETRKMTFMK